jgi:DNA polymerase
MSKAAENYWRLLNTIEDYLRHGERISRDPPRDLQFRVSYSTATGASGGTDSQPAERLAKLDAISQRVAECARCPLGASRLNSVPGVGVLDPLVMVIGEGPGAEEDRRGEPFVGRAGQYLDRWLDAIDVSRTGNAYIGNIVKCRPPGNRDPNPGESDACIPYLKEQIRIIRPHTILSVGRIASGILIGSTGGIGSLRGRTYTYDSIPLVPTYHPAAVLRNPDLRRPVWEDLKRLVALFPSENSDG